MDIHFGGYQGGFTVQPDASCVNPKIDPQFKSNQDLFPVEICAMVLSEMKDIDLVSIHREKCTERSPSLFLHISMWHNTVLELGISQNIGKVHGMKRKSSIQTKRIQYHPHNHTTQQ
eukprot:857668_1